MKQESWEIKKKKIDQNEEFFVKNYQNSLIKNGKKLKKK